MKKNGFSLIELMVVVAIIGVLAAIAVPNYHKFTAKTKQSEAKANLSAIYSSERTFFEHWQTYNTRFTVIGFSPTGLLRYRLGFSADNGVLPTLYTGNAGAAADSTTQTYCTPATGCSEITAPIPPGALPAGTIVVIGANGTFLAGATADIDGDATQDQWTVDQQKKLLQPAGFDDINN